MLEKKPAAHTTTDELIGFNLIFRSHVLNEQIKLHSWCFNYAISNSAEHTWTIQFALVTILLRSGSVKRQFFAALTHLRHRLRRSPVAPACQRPRSENRRRGLND